MTIVALTLAFLALAQPPAPKPVDEQRPESIGASETVRELIRKFPGRGLLSDPNSKPLSPADSLKTFKVPDDLELDLVLAEPIVRQPLHISFDERGRMWVVQYLQYPFPAGLKVVKYDEHLRAVFDRVPLPPPEGDRGADKVTIHEDTDGDGQFDKHSTFVEGLNIATAVLRGRGGVWVMNPPYLLFYPDRDNNDVPDGPPEVHLKGFGLEDTHAVANSLTWGPDGWIYGAQGSTVWATVDSAVSKGVHFKGQAIWRYHPTTKVFEIFAEGGGNTFGIEWDSAGRIYSGHNGGDTRGFHFVQGGYYQKAWGKHGELTNPYAFGYFTQMEHAKIERFSHTFLIYEGGSLPPRYQGKMFAPVPLHRYVVLSEMQPRGSTFATKDLEKVVTTEDKWFRPVDIKAGPDGAIYLADWYDTRLSHVDVRDTWDRAHGRIWRLRPKGKAKPVQSDLAKATPPQLIEALSDANKWTRQTAQRLLADKRDATLAESLTDKLFQEKGAAAVELLWALNSAGGLQGDVAVMALEHPDPHVRAWTVRLMGDARAVSPPIGRGLISLAVKEKDPSVRSQIASTVKRIPGTWAIPVLMSLALARDDSSDPHLPLLVWWAVEAHVATDRDQIVEVLAGSELWKSRVMAETVLPRLARRLAADPQPENLHSLAKLVQGAPGAKEKTALLAAVNEAWKGRRVGRLPAPLAEALASAAGGDRNSPVQVALRLRAGDAEAEKFVVDYIKKSPANPAAQRVAYVELLGQVVRPDSGLDSFFLDLAFQQEDATLARAAITALGSFAHSGVAERLTRDFAKLPPDRLTREAAIDVLSARGSWAKLLVAAVLEKKIDQSLVSISIVERLKVHPDQELQAMVKKLWGAGRASPREIEAQMVVIRQIVAGGSGDAAQGKALFTKSCANCHKLHGEGKTIGPDLTGYERDNLDFLLVSIADPSAAIREEFTQFRVVTRDGRIVTGTITERGNASVTLQSADKGPLTIASDNIEEGPVAMPTSLMPDQLLRDFSSQQIRDLFAYLKTKQPVSGTDK